MAQVERYRQLVQEVLKARVYPKPDVETQTIFDTERDHYQLMKVGWRRGWHRIYGTVIHIDIKGGKIWVQWDGTEDSVAEELVARGVPKIDIVLGYHAPYKRQFTEFARG
ncbi:MAG: XisI protein [Anaerolineales bacterium]